MFIYIRIASYYEDRFIIGTWINGKYVAGMTVEEVNTLLCEVENYDKLEITTLDGECEIVINMEDIDYNVSYITDLNKIKNSRNMYLWGYYYLSNKNIMISPIYSYSKVKLLDIINNFDFIKMARAASVIDKKLEIKWTSKGYQLYDNKTDILDVDRVIELILDRINAKEKELNLVSSKCYYDIEYTSEDLSKIELYDKIKDFQEFDFSYIFGEDEEILTPFIVGKWIKRDGEGEFLLDNKTKKLILDEDAQAKTISDLALKYDTYNTDRVFESASGRKVIIHGGNYGNKINQKKEMAYLKEAFLNTKEESNRVPIYSKKAKYQGLNDIGDTYIEIDISNQKLYFFKEGECFVTTDIVTGNLRLGTYTPSRAANVYAKQKNRILRGETYESFVYYWMPVIGGIGLHDATWRSEFGGGIYKTDGSHGCINLPLNKAEKIYNNVEIGTPVMMYY